MGVGIGMHRREIIPPPYHISRELFFRGTPPFHTENIRKREGKFQIVYKNVKDQDDILYSPILNTNNLMLS
jgi:hypothetical protein